MRSLRKGENPGRPPQLAGQRDPARLVARSPHSRLEQQEGEAHGGRGHGQQDERPPGERFRRWRVAGVRGQATAAPRPRKDAL